MFSPSIVATYVYPSSARSATSRARATPHLLHVGVVHLEQKLRPVAEKHLPSTEQNEVLPPLRVDFDDVDASGRVHAVDGAHGHLNRASAAEPERLRAERVETRVLRSVPHRPRRVAVGHRDAERAHFVPPHDSTFFVSRVATHVCLFSTTVRGVTSTSCPFG